MAVWKKDEYKAPIGALRNNKGINTGAVDTPESFLLRRYQPGELLRLSNTTATYEIDEEALLNIFSECQSLGLLTLSNKKLQWCVRQIPKRCRRLTNTGRFGRNQRADRSDCVQREHGTTAV